jgi:hypothetical protein
MAHTFGVVEVTIWRLPAWLAAVLTFLFLAVPSPANARRCETCDGPFGDIIYTMTDKVTREKRWVCATCAEWPDNCFICGLPVRKNFTAIPDGRFVCERDVKTAVLDETKAKQICNESREALDRLLARFTAIPGTNVEVDVVDRVNLMELFKVPGNDFGCPNILGYTQIMTNGNRVHYSISLMSALPRAEFKAVCAHEYAHCWVFENVSAERRKTLGHNAHEGFCELLAYLLMDAQREEEQKRAILENAYSRGQIHVFVEAEKRYGLYDVLDWMKYGIEAQLKNAAQIRDIELPRSAPRGPITNAPVYARERRPAPETLVLQGVSGTEKRRLALINYQTFAAGESGKVPLGKTNVVIRCLAIADRSARVQIAGSTEELVLYLKSDAR